VLLAAARILVGVALLGVSLYGVVRFHGSNLRSSRYVRDPGRRGWSLFRIMTRMMRDEEWTEAGLQYRRDLVRWWAVWAALTVLLAVLLAH